MYVYLQIVKLAFCICAYQSFFAVEQPAVAMNMDGVGAAPEANQPNSSQTNLLTALLALLCGTFCKDTPLADVVSAPTQDIAVNEQQSGRCLAFVSAKNVRT